MDDRLYRLRPDQAVFETGTAQGKQLLLSANVSQISLYWFTAGGEFLELQRRQIPDGPSGGRVWDVTTGTVISEPVSGYWDKLERAMAPLKEQLGFVPGEIAIRKFETEDAGILDLLGDYVQFLANREEYSKEDQQAYDEYIRKWHEAKDFVLAVDGAEYWMTESGEVASS